MNYCDKYNDCSNCPMCKSIVKPGNLESIEICIDTKDGKQAWKSYVNNLKRENSPN